MTPSEELTPSTAPLVFIEWEDIQAHEDWNEDSEENSTATLKSVGWLIEDSPRKLVIAATYDYENEKWSNKFAIPKLPPTVVPLKIVEDNDVPTVAFRHVPRQADDDPHWISDSVLIPGQP